MWRDMLHLRGVARIFPCGRAAASCSSGTVNMIYRVLAIFGGALALAACSSNPDWMNLDAFKPGPTLDTVSFESEPPGAEAKVSNGQTCRTPCSLALPVDAASSVTFTLNGYQPETEKLDAIQNTGEPSRLRPNPVVVELTPASPPPKTMKKPAKKPAAKKPAARPTAAIAPPPAPLTSAPQAASPWPTSPPPIRQ
jgi:hypothetical protein